MLKSIMENTMQGRMEYIMEEKTDRASENKQGLPFSITGEDEAAQQALLEKKPTAKKKKSSLSWLLAMGALVLVAALLLGGVIPGLKQSAKQEPTISAPADAPDDETGADQPDAQPDTDAQPEQDAQAEAPTDQTQSAGNGVSYTVSAEEMTDELLDQTVATCGDDRLTNRDLPYYYWQQYNALYSSYGSYTSYFIDPATPFDEQLCAFDETLTWQQYFLQAALTTYERISALWQDARLAGFELGEEEQTYLDELETNLNIAALSEGYANADEYLQQVGYGPTATVNGYRNYVERYLIATAYVDAQVDAQDYTDADISAYYDENAEAYIASGIEKSDVNMINIRHILIMPTETDDDGNYTDEAWAEAEATAQAVYDEWKNGERTEDAFALLAAENSVDSSASNGGLIENVYPGQMVESFDAWCFDAARQPGDTDVIQSEYGYHIMYFSAQCEHPLWYTYAQSDYLTQLWSNIVQQAADKFAAEQTIENAALVDMDLLQG